MNTRRELLRSMINVHLFTRKGIVPKVHAR